MRMSRTSRQLFCGCGLVAKWTTTKDMSLSAPRAEVVQDLGSHIAVEQMHRSMVEKYPLPDVSKGMRATGRE